MYHLIFNFEFHITGVLVFYDVMLKLFMFYGFFLICKKSVIFLKKIRYKIINILFFGFVDNLFS